MRSKRKTCERVSFHLPELQQNHFEEKQIMIKYMKDILHANDGIQQIAILKEIELHLLHKGCNSEELQFLCGALCTMFYQAPLKSSQKKTLNRIIQEISKKHIEAIELSLQKSLERITNFPYIEMSLEELGTSMQYIISLLDNLELGRKVVNLNSLQIWQYINFVFKSIIEDLKQEINLQKEKDLYKLCQIILKLITNIIQNCDILKNFLAHENSEEFQVISENLKLSFEYLLKSDKTDLNCRLNAAFALCYYLDYSGKINLLLSENLRHSGYCLASKLCLLSGIMAVLPIEDFLKKIADTTLAINVLLENLNISKSVDDSEVLILCARNILQWTNVMLSAFNKDVLNATQLDTIVTMFSKDENLLKMLFEYVLYNREHFIDTVRHLSREIFQKILNLHVLSLKIEAKNSTWMKEITLFLLNELPSYCRGKYGMLSCIVELISTEVILEWHPSLPDELYGVLDECGLVSHVSEFCQVLYQSSLGYEIENFQVVWLKPLLKVLCNGSHIQTNAISEHILPKLLNVKTSNLTYLVSELSAMWENNIESSFGALVCCLKVYQKQKGSLIYLQFISNDSLKKAFSHANDQIRLSAFSLICESYKATELIDQSVFEILVYALPDNINCQSPSFRQQLVSYMKKLFIRMIESGYASKRKMNSAETISVKSNLPLIYMKFLQWIKGYLCSCLYPGANFPRRVTSLNLLYLLNELFSNCIILVDSEASFYTLLHIFQDTYDNNKLLALKILSSESALSFNLKKIKLSLKYSALKQKFQRIEYFYLPSSGEIFSVVYVCFSGDKFITSLALDENEILLSTSLTLASSTKPPDTTAAAYLFALMVQCPNYYCVLQEHVLSSQNNLLNFAPPVSSDFYQSSYFYTIFVLMNELSSQLQFAQRSLLEAAVHAPMYGILTCIRGLLCDVKFNDFDDYSFLHWQCLLKELVSLSMIVTHVVEPIVCNSSPEGHLPMDTDDDNIAQLQSAVRRALGCRFQSAIIQENPLIKSNEVVLDIVKTHAVTAQILLLCCWRTHKEVSLLLGDICERVPLIIPNSACNGILGTCQVMDIGKYFIHQMSLVKHKGAFEQAYIGFTKLCQRLWRCNISELHELPKLWLNDLILATKGLKKDIQLCSTRRSAGVPFIVQGLLTSEPTIVSSSFFKKCMLDFLDLAQHSPSQTYDAQIHALNILRALFRDACLGEAVMPFVSTGLKISIEGFKSHLWGVRNSSTLLFSALMTRTFGVNRSHDETEKKNKLTGKSFFSHYRDLYKFLYNELEQCVSTLYQNMENKISIQPSLYPILLLLTRLYPAPGEKDMYLSSFIPFLQLCISSPIWKTRSLAAKALVSFTSYENIPSTLQTIVETLSSGQTTFPQNRIHGYLLVVHYILEEFLVLSELQKISVRTILQSWFITSCDFYVRCNKCSSTKASYLEIVLLSMSFDIDIDYGLTITLYQAMFAEEIISCIPDNDSYLSISVVVLLLQMSQVHSITNESKLSLIELLTHFIKSPFKIVRSTTIELLLWSLQEDTELSKHCPDSSDDIVILHRIIKILNKLDRKKFYFQELFKEPNYVSSCLVEVLDKENDSSCMRQIYKLLRLIPISPSHWTFLSNSYSRDLLNILEYVLDQMESCSRDEVECEMLLYSSYLIVNLCEEFKVIHQNKLSHDGETFDVIKKWLKIVEDSACPENSILLRQTAVSILQILTDTSIFPNCESISSLYGSSLLSCFDSFLWQSLLLLLTDDEPEIKYLASKILSKMMLPTGNVCTGVALVPTKALDLMIERYVTATSKCPNECINMLIKWILSSNNVPFDIINDEHPFDKGEMNIFSEDFNLTNIAAKHLLSFLKSQEHNNILAYKVTCWKGKQNECLTFSEVVMLCLDESRAIVNCTSSRASSCAVLDTYLDNELLYIYQYLTLISILLPWSDMNPEISMFGNEIMHNIERLNFRTLFIEDIISKLKQILFQLSD